MVEIGEDPPDRRRRLAPEALVKALKPGTDGPNAGDAIVVRVGGRILEMPDFNGLPKRKVVDRCADLGIRLEGKGSGVAVCQVPLPGTNVCAGEVCYVTFARSAAAARNRVPGLTGTLPLASSRSNGPAAARP